MDCRLLRGFRETDPVTEGEVPAEPNYSSRCQKPGCDGLKESYAPTPFRLLNAAGFCVRTSMCGYSGAHEGTKAVVLHVGEMDLEFKPKVIAEHPSQQIFEQPSPDR